MINKTLGNWQIERLLAKGGMGEVYLARHNRLGTLAAVKVLPPLLSSDADLRQRFFQEAQTQAHLRHPHIAQILDFIEEGGSLFQLIEYLHGGTLADVQQRSGNPPLPLVLTWSNQVLAALAYAHDCGVIHRDIKPSNILLDQHGDAKLTDFGIALVLGDKRLTSTGKFLGTPEYMSPEQITMPKAIDARSDIYSMGIVLFELLTGKVPFTGETDYAICKSQVNDKPPDIGHLNSSVSPVLEDIVKRALQKNPVDRYQTCKEFLHSLERFEQSQPFHSVRSTRVGGEQSGRLMPGRGLGHLGVRIRAHPRLWKRAQWLITAAVLLLVAGLAWFVYIRPRILARSVPADSKGNRLTNQKNQVLPEHILATLSEEELQSGRPIPILSPGGKSIAYKIKHANQFYVVINGVRGPGFDEVGVSDEHAFTEEGSKFAYSARTGKRYCIMVNNLVHREFEIEPNNLLSRPDLGRVPPQFSHHGDTLLYVVPKGNKVAAIAGEWEGPPFDFIKRPQFSGDDTAIAYIAEQRLRDHLVVGEWRGLEHDNISEFAISRNGSRVAYIASEHMPHGKLTEFVVSGEWRSPVYNSDWHKGAGVSDLQLSPDGDELIYSVNTGAKISLVLHGKREAEYLGIESIYGCGLLSPDGTAQAFVMKQGGKYCVVANDRYGPAFDEVFLPLRAFSPDSSRLGYFARVGGKVFLVCGDARGPECELAFQSHADLTQCLLMPFEIQFAPDGTEIGYAAFIGREIWWKILDLR
jgi:hypothetical protein